jgi:hypothetical protein
MGILVVEQRGMVIGHNIQQIEVIGNGRRMVHPGPWVIRRGVSHLGVTRQSRTGRSRTDKTLRPGTAFVPEFVAPRKIYNTYK